MASMKWLFLGTAILAMAAPLAAHHSYAATYFENKTATIEGNVVKVTFRNPHSFITVEAPDAHGELARWAVEWASGQALSGHGITHETLKVADHVVVIGNPSRDAADYRMRMLSITRPKDGWRWSGTLQ